MAVVVATGIAADGSRDVLGLDVGDSEEETFWRGFMTSLKQRGLGGVRLVISDQHAGLVKALRRSFQGAGHQRCRVHFARNLLACVPKSHADMVAAARGWVAAGVDDLGQERAGHDRAGTVDVGQRAASVLDQSDDPALERGGFGVDDDDPLETSAGQLGAGAGVAGDQVEDSADPGARVVRLVIWCW